MPGSVPQGGVARPKPKMGKPQPGGPVKGGRNG
jgi:hypothetical protein